MIKLNYSLFKIYVVKCFLRIEEDMLNIVKYSQTCLTRSWRDRKKSSSYPRIRVIQKTKHPKLGLVTREKVRDMNDITFDCSCYILLIIVWNLTPFNLQIIYNDSSVCVWCVFTDQWYDACFFKSYCFKKYRKYIKRYIFLNRLKIKFEWSSSKSQTFLNYII